MKIESPVWQFTLLEPTHHSVDFETIASLTGRWCNFPPPSQGREAKIQNYGQIYTTPMNQRAAQALQQWFYICRDSEFPPGQYVKSPAAWHAAFIDLVHA